MNIAEPVLIAAINAARGITVAKINAKGPRFDAYISKMDWFNQSINEVIDSINRQNKEAK